MGAGLSITDGRKVVAATATAERLVANHQICSSVIITAETDNTNPVTIGGSTVVGALATRRGIPLAAGETIVFNCRDLYDVWIDGLTNGEGVTFLAITE